MPKFLSSSSRQRAVKQQTDQQSASPSGHYSGLLENGSAAGAQHRGGADAAGPGPAPAAAGSAGRATSFKLPPSPKSPTAWAEGLDPCTNLERLFLALTPVLRQGSERSPVLVSPPAPALLIPGLHAGWLAARVLVKAWESTPQRPARDAGADLSAEVGAHGRAVLLCLDQLSRVQVSAGQVLICYSCAG